MLSHVNFKQMHGVTPKLTLASIISKLYHICITSVTEYQILFRSVLRPDVFQLQNILRPVQNDPKVTLNTIGSHVPTYVYYCFEFKFHFVPPYGQPFLMGQSILRPINKMTMDTTRSKVPDICVHMSSNPKFHSGSYTNNSFEVVSHFVKSAHNDHKMTPRGPGQKYQYMSY